MAPFKVPEKKKDFAPPDFNESENDTEHEEETDDEQESQQALLQVITLGRLRPNTTYVDT